jgi:O-antigen/teichoic acid export membrane protein
VTTPDTAPRKEGPLRTDVVLTAANKVVVLLTTLGASIVLARALGPAGRGEWAVAMALVLTLVQLGSMGVQSANPYFAARGAAPLGRIVANSLWLALGLGLVLIGVAAGTKAVLPDVVKGLEWRELAIAAAAVPALLAAMFLQSVLLGEGRMVAYNTVEAGQAVAVLIALLAAAELTDLTVAGALAIFTAMQFVLTLTFALLLRRHRPPFASFDARLATDMFRYGLRVYIATFLAFIVVRIDILLVNGYLGADDAGYYSLAVGLADSLYVLPVAVAVNVFPRVTRGAGAEATAQVFRALALVYGGVCLVAAALAPVAVSLLYGDRFDPTVELFWWLAPGIFCLGLLTLLSHHFAGRGFPREAVLVWIPGLALNVAINVVFLPGGPTYVASLASSVAYALLLVLHMRLFAREAGGYRMLLPRPRDVVDTARALLRPAAS